MFVRHMLGSEVFDWRVRADHNLESGYSYLIYKLLGLSTSESKPVVHAKGWLVKRIDLGQLRNIHLGVAFKQCRGNDDRSDM